VKTEPLDDGAAAVLRLKKKQRLVVEVVVPHVSAFNKVKRDTEDAGAIQAKLDTLKNVSKTPTSPSSRNPHVHLSPCSK